MFSAVACVVPPANKHEIHVSVVFAVVVGMVVAVVVAGVVTVVVAVVIAVKIAVMIVVLVAVVVTVVLVFVVAVVVTVVVVVVVAVFATFGLKLQEGLSQVAQDMVNSLVFRHQACCNLRRLCCMYPDPL